MNCPGCGKPMKYGSIKNSRWFVGYVLRRRECGYCGHRVTTKEQIVEANK